MIHSQGTCVLLELQTLNELLGYVQALHRNSNAQFELKGVHITEITYESFDNQCRSVVTNNVTSFEMLCYLRNKTCFPCLHSLVKRGEHLGEFESCRSVKSRDAGFHKHCRGFQQAMEARTTCFISFSFIKFFFIIVNKEKY